MADGADQARGHRRSVERPDVARRAAVEQFPEPAGVLRESLMVTAVQHPHRVVGGGVHVIDGTPDRRQTAGEEDLAQAARRDAQVVQRAEAAE
jgi:hypothetical protein